VRRSNALDLACHPHPGAGGFGNDLLTRNGALEGPREIQQIFLFFLDFVDGDEDK
jgi:hypothetical protein